VCVCDLESVKVKSNLRTFKWFVILCLTDFCCFLQHQIIYYLTLLLGHSPAMSQRLVPLFTVSIYFMFS